MVVNGERFNAATLKALYNRQGILLHYQHLASGSITLGIGRHLVTAPFFACLDDDDELIARALGKALNYMGHR